MGTCPDTVKRLIDRFEQQSDQIRSPDYNETLIRIDFINPLMRELGWDMDNSAGYAERYREVVHEERVKVAGQTKAPDYSFRVGGARKFFLEAKKPAVDIKNNWEPAYQLRRYAWSAKLACSLLTDFEEFAIYDTRLQPKQLDKPSTGRREFIRYTDYCDRWDFLSGTFSKDAVLKGEFDRYCESKKGRGAQPFDDAFLAEIEEWRKAIAGSLARNADLRLVGAQVGSRNEAFQSAIGNRQSAIGNRKYQDAQQSPAVDGPQISQAPPPAGGVTAARGARARRGGVRGGVVRAAHVRPAGEHRVAGQRTGRRRRRAGQRVVVARDRTRHAPHADPRRDRAGGSDGIERPDHSAERDGRDGDRRRRRRRDVGGGR